MALRASRFLFARVRPGANTSPRLPSCSRPSSLHCKRGLSAKADSKSNVSMTVSQPSISAVVDASSSSSLRSPSVMDMYSGSMTGDCTRWILLAFFVTGATFFASAIITNELSERALSDSAAMLDLYKFDISLDEYIAKHGNDSLSVILRRELLGWGRRLFDAFNETSLDDWSMHAHVRYVNALESFIPKFPPKDQHIVADFIPVYEEFKRSQNEITLAMTRFDSRKIESEFLQGAIGLAFLMRAPFVLASLHPDLQRKVFTHSPYSPRSYSLLTSLFQLPPQYFSGHWIRSLLYPLSSTLSLSYLCLSPTRVLIMQESESSPSDLMEATSIGRLVSLLLPAAIWGNTLSSIAQRAQASYSARNGALTSATVLQNVGGWRGALAALAVYPLLTAAHTLRIDWSTGASAYLDAALLAFAPIAVMRSPGGAAFALAYAVGGQATFDGARRVTCSAERYPLLYRFRALQAESVEKRAVRAREYIEMDARWKQQWVKDVVGYVKKYMKGDS